MKNSILLFLFFSFFQTTQLFAHNIWIEANPIGTAENTQQIQNGRYIAEAVCTEENPGEFLGTDIEATRHTANYSIKAE